MEYPIIMKIILFFLSLVSSSAMDVTLTWAANPATEKVTEYRIYKLSGTTKTLLTSSVTTTTKITVAGGESIIVTAFNGIESDPSTAIVIPTIAKPTPPASVKIVEIQVSDNLKEWRSIAYIPLDEKNKNAMFVRGTITEILK